MKNQPWFLILVGPLMLIPAFANAHHSFAMFEMDKPIEKKGVVKEFQWANPHVWINFIVTNEQGEPEEWGLEAGSTNSLIRHGWSKESLKPGDKIDAILMPMKNGTHAGSIKTVTKEDGTVLGLGAQNVPEQYDAANPGESSEDKKPSP